MIELGHELAGIAPLQPTSNSVMVVVIIALCKLCFVRCLNIDIMSNAYPLPIWKFILSVWLGTGS